MFAALMFRCIFTRFQVCFNYLEMIKLCIFAWHSRGFLMLFFFSLLLLSTLVTVEVLIGCLGSGATVIIFLQMLEWELGGGGERGEKTSAAATISTSAVELIYPSL